MSTTTCRIRHHGDCTTVMRPASIEATLDYHGVKSRRVDTVAGPIVEAWEEATMNGADASGWVMVPCTLHGLAEWLGY